jgi:predicted DNA-binding antitoxin AbrB/MazE fold protein
MLNHRTTIRAVFDQGVLRPVEPLELPEGTTVEIILDPEALAKRVEASMRRSHRRNRRFSLEEVESDVEQAIREVRAEQRKARPSSDRS